MTAPPADQHLPKQFSERPSAAMSAAQPQRASHVRHSAALQCPLPRHSSLRTISCLPKMYHGRPSAAMAAGWPNRAIIRSPRTVQAHCSLLYSSLGQQSLGKSALRHQGTQQRCLLLSLLSYRGSAIATYLHAMLASCIPACFQTLNPTPPFLLVIVPCLQQNARAGCSF